MHEPYKTWTQIKLSSADLLAGEGSRLRDEFASAFMAAGAPREAALLENSPNSNSTVFYFTPAASNLFGRNLLRYSAEATVAPPLEGSVLVVGVYDALGILLDRKP